MSTTAHGIKFDIDIYGPHRMNPNDLVVGVGPLTLAVALLLV